MFRLLLQKEGSFYFKTMSVLGRLSLVSCHSKHMSAHCALEYSGRCTFHFPVESELHAVKDTGVLGTEEEAARQNLTLHLVFETINQEYGRPILICDSINIFRVLSNYCSKILM